VNFLDDLGVSLMEVEVRTSTTTTENPRQEGEDDDDGGGGGDVAVDPPSTAIERILHRQSDEKVAAEMMASLRTLIKASSLIGLSPGQMNADMAAVFDDDDEDDDDLSEVDKQEREFERHCSIEERQRWRGLRRRYHPFCRGGQLHTPTVYFSKDADDEGDEGGFGETTDSVLPEHPASEGLKKLMTVLHVMDAHCGDDWEDDDWNAIFSTNDGNEDGEGVVGG
jgi:hypothetical protein